MAAGMEESGTGMTTSASTGASRASSSPRSLAHLVDAAARPRCCRGGRNRCARRCTAPAGLRAACAWWTRQGGVAQRDDLAGLHLADGLAAQGAQRAGFGGGGVPAAGQQADAQRAEAPRVAHGEDAVAGQDHQGIGATPLGHACCGCARSRCRLRRPASIMVITSVSEEEDRPTPLLQQLLAQLGGVDQVAVVRHGHRAVAGSRSGRAGRCAQLEEPVVE